ncbi:cupin domain-containing protein [Prochlorococcus sp. AH-716-K03]|nr:cupin domain-containing protein [Prochlorococcus sp. AH-716-K03]
MFKQFFLVLTCVLLLFNFNASYAIDEKSPVDVQEIFTSSENIDGDNFKYPKGKAEMRLIRVEVDKGGTIPMHSHPVPLLGHIESGELTLDEKTGISKTFKEGDSFVLSANTPAHTMGNTGDSSAVMWVAVASAKGLPTLNPEE